MKKLTSILTFLVVSLYILSCNRSDVDQNSSNSESMAILNVDATSIDQNNVNNLISGSHFTTLKSIADDDRKL